MNPSPAIGPGNISAALGVPGPQNPAVRPPMMGNIGVARPQAAAPKVSPQQALAGLSPQATQALRSIPKGTWQQLSSAGLIHPALMQHIGG